jgi:putative colanic acid biosynthesis UDP-glucose lipid carrier transferase
LLIQPFDYRINRILKRIADLFLATFAIICVLSWLISIVAVLIKLNSKGPVFFLQKRNKRNGKIFNCIKFRSMIINEEADLLPAAENDTRITRVGKFLRKNYLDELPQFFNVLWGDMSVIGPRPHMISDNLRYDELIEHYSYRNRVKPGITGLAQVMGYVGLAADIQKMQDRVNMDIFYVRHWSLKLDITILYHTILKTFD